MSACAAAGPMRRQCRSCRRSGPGLRRCCNGSLFPRLRSRWRGADAAGSHVARADVVELTCCGRPFRSIAGSRGPARSEEETRDQILDRRGRGRRAGGQSGVCDWRELRRPTGPDQGAGVERAPGPVHDRRQIPGSRASMRRRQGYGGAGSGRPDPRADGAEKQRRKLRRADKPRQSGRRRDGPKQIGDGAVWLVAGRGKHLVAASPSQPYILLTRSSRGTTARVIVGHLLRHRGRVRFCLSGPADSRLSQDGVPSKLCSSLEVSRAERMDEIRHTISPHDLHRSIGTAASPLIIDVRRPDAFDADDTLIAGAIRRLPDAVERWRNELPTGRRVVAYCAHGQQVSQGVAAALLAAGADAGYLEGGISAWRTLGLPTRRRIGAAPGKWVTRERPKVDRIACPWLIRRFIDPEAEFLYVPSAQVREVAARTGAVPYDIADVAFGHVGDHCSFDAFIRIYGIADHAIDQIAVMHRILVEEKRWIGETRFLHALNYCMLLPGPEAQQLAVYIGWLLHRMRGGLVAGTLFVLPGMVALMALSWLYAGFGEVGVVKALFFGLTAAVLAVVLEAVVRVGKRALKNRMLEAVAALAFIGIVFFAVPFPIVVIAAGLIGFAGNAAGVAAFRPAAARPGAAGTDEAPAAIDAAFAGAIPEHVRPSARRAVKVAAIGLTLWLGPLLALLLTLGPGNVFTTIAVFFSEMAVVTFGGAYAVLAYVAQEAVQSYHWLP